MFDRFFFSLLLHFSDSFLSGKYTKYFLSQKDSSKNVMVIWCVGFLLAQILIIDIFDYYFYINSLIFNIVVNAVLLYILQILLFKKDIPKQIFIIASFLSGKYLIEYIFRVYHSNFVNWLIFIQQNYINNLISNNYYQTIINKTHGIITALIYTLLLLAYIYLIKKAYIKKDYTLNKRESIFLVFPCITSLCVCVTLILIFNFIEKEANMFIYDKIPSTNFTVPLICIMLAFIIVANVSLFQNLLKYNEENQKRVFLENQVIQTKKEVTEIENIYSDMRGLRHDMQSHINSILLYVKNNKVENSIEIENYIGKMEDTISRLDFSYHCGNPIIDIIIHQAQQRARTEGIEFFVDFVYPVIPQTLYSKRHCEASTEAVAIQNELEVRDERGDDQQEVGSASERQEVSESQIRELASAYESLCYNYHCQQNLDSVAIHKRLPLLRGDVEQSETERFLNSNEKISLSPIAFSNQPLQSSFRSPAPPPFVGEHLPDIPLYESGSKENITNSNDKKSINSPIDVYDMAVILNNALENAFTACQSVTNGKSINLHSYLKGNLFFIEVENTFSWQLTFNETTGLPESQKPDKKLHGIGLSNIQKCAKKYLGDLDIEIRCNNGVQQFNLTVMMKV